MRALVESSSNTPHLPLMETADARDLLQSLLDAAIASASPATCVPPYLPEAPAGRTVVVGAGKAAAAMARAVETHWRRRAPLSGLVITRYGHGVPCDRIEVVEAGHPLPDSAGERAAAEILRRVQGLTPNDLVLCLLSGGGSALLAVPAPGISLDDKREVTQALLNSGASIAEINCVRKHLSAIKGGRLAGASFPAALLTLAISDVPGDDPSVIASGPTVADPSTLADARAVLTKFGISAPLAVVAHLATAANETPKPSDSPATASFQIIARPRDALDAAAATAARRTGLRALVVGDALQGDARLLGQTQGQMALHVAANGEPISAPAVLLSGGETTVRVQGNGQGGPQRGIPPWTRPDP